MEKTLFIPVMEKEKSFLLPVLVEMEDGELAPDIECPIAHMFTSPQIGEESLSGFPFPLLWQEIDIEDALYGAIIALPESGAGLIQINDLFFPLTEFGLEHTIAMRFPYRSVHEGKKVLIQTIAKIYDLDPEEILASLPEIVNS